MANKYANASVVDILDACVERDDELAWLALRPMIEQIGKPYIGKLTNTSKGVNGEDFPPWLYSELYIRCASAREEVGRRDPLGFILDAMRENGTPAEEQEAELGRRLGDRINRWFGPEFIRQMIEGRHDVVPPTPPVIAPAGASGEFDDSAKLVKRLADAAEERDVPLVYLRLYWFVQDLPDFVVNHVMAVQEELEEDKRVIPLDTGDDTKALKAFVRDQDVDKNEWVRWKPLSLLLNLPTNTLMTRWCRLMKCFPNTLGGSSDA